MRISLSEMKLLFQYDARQLGAVNIRCKHEELDRFTDLIEVFGELQHVSAEENRDWLNSAPFEWSLTIHHVGMAY